MQEFLKMLGPIGLAGICGLFLVTEAPHSVPEPPPVIRYRDADPVWRSHDTPSGFTPLEKPNRFEAIGTDDGLGSASFL